MQVILRSWGVADFDSERIFGLGSGPKIETIHRLVMAHEAEVTAALGHAADHVRAEGRLVPVRAHFFEDKLSTLAESAEHPLSKKIDVRFYLARWGYVCTDGMGCEGWEGFKDALACLLSVRVLFSS